MCDPPATRVTSASAAGSPFRRVTESVMVALPPGATTTGPGVVEVVGVVVELVSVVLVRGVGDLPSGATDRVTFRPRSCV